MDNSYKRAQDDLHSELEQLDWQAKRKELAERVERAQNEARVLGLNRDAIEFQLFYDASDPTRLQDLEKLEQKIANARLNSK